MSDTVNKKPDESDDAFNMKDCNQALDDAVDPEKVVENALKGRRDSDEDDDDDEEDDDEFAEARDSVDSDVEYDDEYMKKQYKDLSPTELEDLRTEVKRLKEEGNDLYKNQHFKEAIKKYTQALNKCPLQLTSERSILFANRAAVKVSMDKKKEAVLDCSKAIELNPNYIKALLRRAQLHRKLDNLEQSLEDYKKILELCGNHTEARYACATLPQEINEKNEKMKEEMLGKLKELGNMVLRPFGMSTDNFKVVQDPNTGGYSISMQK